ncbi:PASTA domain-containing protein [Methylonatrum kenyense]|uniref:PASTA domain-containing protein n=1 Tax=Methylonatrum kenyense TaxID=455253 RepID=UPI0020BD90CB|nr:PASTA domain-containing protein [Methylonatrum kenyense]MCK8515371.1 PASTA domain-containing protein [Methylonatrum kenyense]
MPRRFDTLVDDVVASPLGKVISAVGEGVADAQRELDQASLAQTLEIYGGGDGEALELLRQIGYQPTFYALPETTGEVKVSLNLGGGKTGNGGPGESANRIPQLPGFSARVPSRPLTLYATPVNASVSNRYSYSANVAATLSFKIVPVPPPSGSESLRAVPAFVDMTVRKAREIAVSLGLRIAFLRDGKTIEEPDGKTGIEAQRPAAGEIIEVGDRIELELAAE